MTYGSRQGYLGIEKKAGVTQEYYPTVGGWQIACKGL